MYSNEPLDYNPNSVSKQEALAVWSLVMDVSLIDKVSVRLDQVQFNSLVRSALETDYQENPNPRQEVLDVARFIANINPAYLNSEGQYVHLNRLRAMPNLGQEDIDYVINRLEEVVKPYISVSTQTVMTGLKLKLATSIPKKKLIKAALLHLLTGCEIMGSRAMYEQIKERSLMAGTPKINYAHLIGVAKRLEYPNVPALMFDLGLTFIDQTKNIEETGTLIFYEGSTRVEKM